MKCTVSKDVLQSMLAKVQGFTERKSTLPILSHILMEAGQEGLRIKATDLHTSIQVTRECDVAESGACAINAKSFFDLIRQLPNEDVQISTDDNARAHIVVGNYKTNMNIMDPEEYPAVEFKNMDSGTNIDPEIVKFMIDRTIFSIPVPDEDDTQYTLGGALFTSGTQGKQNYIEMVTTDSRRLSAVRYPITEKLDMGDGIIIPRKGVQELKRLMEGGDESAGILLTSDAIFFVSADTIATVRLIDGRFPDYGSVINLETYPIVSRMSAVEIMNALKVCSAMMSDISNCVKFTYGSGQAVLYAHNPDQGDVETVVAAEHQGDEIEVNFNPRYFMDCLGHISGDVEVRLKSSQGPCLMTPADNSDVRWVIMPMRF